MKVLLKNLKKDNFGSGADGAGAEIAINGSGSGTPKLILAPPAPQHCLKSQYVCDGYFFTVQFEWVDLVSRRLLWGHEDRAWSDTRISWWWQVKWKL